MPDPNSNPSLNTSSSRMYMLLVIILGSMGIASVTAITILRPDGDNGTIIATIIGFITPIMVSILALMQKDTHDMNNSRLTELLELTKTSSIAEGRLEEKTETESTDPTNSLIESDKKLEKPIKVQIVTPLPPGLKK